MPQIKLIFNDGAGFYDERLMTTLFPLIANVREDCEHDALAIPFAKMRFDTLVADCLKYLRAPFSIWSNRDKLYEFLLCVIGEKSARKTVEQYFARNGLLELLKLRFELCTDVCRKRVCAYAASAGHIAVLEWAREHGCKWGAKTCEFAASKGRLETLKWLREASCPWDFRTCIAAASNGHLETLKWAFAQGCASDSATAEWDNWQCVKAAAGNGHLIIIKYLKAQGFDLTGACEYAAASGQLETLKWLHEEGFKYEIFTRVLTTGGSMSEALQWAQPWNKNDCLQVAPTQEMRDWILAQPY